jgi:hypothetical protein
MIENVLLKGALLAEMIEVALLKSCYEQIKQPEDYEDDIDTIIERAIANTEIELCEGERIELQREVFEMIQDYIGLKSTGKTKQKIQAIYVKYHAKQSEIEKLLEKAKEGVETANNVTEKAKEIYEGAKPVISTVVAVINLLKVFFKK